ncbi:MAG: HIT family protein [Nanoarchaeota archaeon]
MKCEYCDIIDRKSRAQILYEDDEAVVAVKDLVALPGQITVFPKEHFTIMETVPDKILEKCSLLAGKVSTAIFDGLECQGTNVIVQNGLGAGQKVPHFALEVIPRRENDGLNFQWKPIQLVEEEMERTSELLEAGMSEVEKEEKKKTIVIEDKKTEVKLEKGENYLLKSLRRKP